MKRVDKHDGHTAKTKNRHTRLTNCREQTEQIVRLQRTLQDTTDGQTLQNGDTTGGQILQNGDTTGGQVAKIQQMVRLYRMETQQVIRF